LKQRNRDFQGAVAIARQGVAHFPESEELHLCLGTSLMNLGRFQEALECLLPFKKSPQVRYFIAEAYGALGDSDKQAAFALQSHKP
jgi:predicted Zn-dependent protease